MSCRSPSRIASWLMAGTAVLALAAASCFPVNWLPDSSGFVFVSGGKVQLFDVKEKNARAIIELGKNMIAWPAIDPAGKRVAVALVEREPNKAGTLDIVACDLSGKEVHRANKLPWHPAAEEGAEDTSTYLFWSPAGQGDKLIVRGDKLLGIYDVPTGEVARLGDRSLAVFGGTPIRPDGRLFLMTQEGEGVPALAVVDWKGSTLPVELRVDLALTASEEALLPRLVSTPLLFQSAWTGNTAIASHQTLRVSIDTEARVGRVERVEAPRPQGVAEGEVLMQQFVFASGGTVRVVEFIDPTASQFKNRFRVESLAARDVKPQVLVKSAPHFAYVTPSPDQKHVAVACGLFEQAGGTSHQRFLAINERLEVVADVAK
jgi:hypothetical protein